MLIWMYTKSGWVVSFQWCMPGRASIQQAFIQTEPLITTFHWENLIYFSWILLSVVFIDLHRKRWLSLGLWHSSLWPLTDMTNEVIFSQLRRVSYYVVMQQKHLVVLFSLSAHWSLLTFPAEICCDNSPSLAPPLSGVRQCARHAKCDSTCRKQKCQFLTA